MHKTNSKFRLYSSLLFLIFMYQNILFASNPFHGKNFTPKNKWNHATIPTPPVKADGSEVNHEEALALALQKTDGGIVVKSEIERKKHGKIIYEFKIINAGVKYEIEIDSHGNVVEFTQKSGLHYYHPPQYAKSIQATDDTSALTPPAPAQHTLALGFAELQKKAFEAIEGGILQEYKLENMNGIDTHKFAIKKDDMIYNLELRSDGTILSIRSSD